MKLNVSRRLRGKFGYIAGLGVAVAVGGLTAASVMAAIPDSSGVIHACYATKDGTNLHVIDTENGGACTAKETALDWNQTGPQGPQGPQGPAGSGGSGEVLANQLVIPTGDLNTGDTPRAILTVPGFGVLEATECDANGSAVYRLHNTTDHPVVLNYNYDSPLEPGDSQNYGSPNLTEGSGSDYRIASMNTDVTTTSVMDENGNQVPGNCIFDAQAIINTDVQSQ